MNNSRNKKLLASFLTALGLTTNSANVNVSASFKQFGSDLRFALKVLGGEKAQERNKLDELADEINSFSNSSEKKASDYLKLCSKLKSNLDELKQKRDNRKYNSRLATSINEVINNYPENCNNYGYGTADMKNWVNSVSQTVNGRYYTVWDENIKNAVTKLSQIDTDYLYYETENNIQKFINLIPSCLNNKMSIQGIEIAKENSEKIIRNAIDAIINRKFKQIVGMFDLKNRKIYDYGYGVVGDDYKKECDYGDFANKLFDIMFRNGQDNIKINYNKEDFKNFEVVEEAKDEDNEKIHENILQIFTDVFNDKKQMGHKWCNLVFKGGTDQLALSFEVDGKKYSMYILPECGYHEFGTCDLYEKKYNFNRIKQVALVSESKTDGFGVIIEVNPKENDDDDDDDDNDVSFVSNKNNEINNTGKNIQNLNKAALNSDKCKLNNYYKEHPEKWQLLVKNLIDDAKEMISSQINKKSKKSKFDVVGVFDFNNKKIYDYYYDIEKYENEDNDYYDIRDSFGELGKVFLTAQESREKAAYNWNEFSVIQGDDGKTSDNQTFTKNILSFFNNVFNNKEEIKNCVCYHWCDGIRRRLMFDFVVNNKKYSFIVLDHKYKHQLVLFSESDGKALIIEDKED